MNWMHQGSASRLLNWVPEIWVPVCGALAVRAYTALPMPNEAGKQINAPMREWSGTHCGVGGFFGCNHRSATMPAKSQAQQKAAGAALAAKRGEEPKSKLKGPSREMYESMSEKQLDEFASTKRSKLPAHKRES
jgi:hypothetical protein